MIRSRIAHKNKGQSMLPDEQFAHFIVLDRLGRGAMATVYKARDTRTQDVVALKVLHEHYSTNEEVIRRFNREADIFYRLKHPNIVTIVDHGVIDGTFYIAMPYMAGGTLYESFYDPQEIEVEFTISILTQLASALDYAHKQGVIHRDLKLENILLDENSKPYLADFGIALLADATRLTANQTSLGTPAYMSPEQAQGSEITPLSDLYSLAVIAYLMTTGYHPFTGPDPYVVLFQHISKPPPVPTMVNKTLPRAVNPVLLRALEKEPAKRFSTATYFVMALEDALTKDNLKTQTYIQLNAINPQATKQDENYKDTVIADVKSPITTTSPTDTPSNTNRMRIVGGLTVIILVAVGLIFMIVSNINQEAENLAIAQTQVWQDIQIEMTETAEAIEVSLPTGVISRPDGARFRSSSEPNAEDFEDIPFGETVILIGRNGVGDSLEVETEDDLTGFVKADQIDAEIDIMTLPVTHQQDSNDNQDETCEITPFATLIDDNVKILHVPSLDGRVLMTRPIDDRLKILGRDADNEFFEVEVDDNDKTRGFIVRGQFKTKDDLSCLREIPRRDTR
jgi:serine/threonine protein kinase